MVHHDALSVTHHTSRHRRTIQVGVKQEAYNLAQRLAERPVVLIRVVVDEEGQSEDVQGVAHGQVEHVDSGGLPALGAEQHHIQRSSVQRQADNKDQGIADGQENVFETFLKDTVEVAVIGLAGYVVVPSGHLGYEDT